MKPQVTLAAAAVAALVLAGCQSQPVRMGSPEAKTVATGAAGGATATNVNSELERCAAPLGTLALLEDQNQEWYYRLTREYKLTSTQPLLRLLVQQSNCFVVVERGRGMQQIQGERALAQSGELRQESNFGKGQLVAADYGLTPTVIFSQNDAGGLGGAIGGRSRGANVLGAIIGSMKTREASTMLALVDNRSGVQVGVAEGSASTTDIGLFAGLAGSRAAGGLGGYTNTPEGKVIAGAFTDAYNQLVRAVKNYRPQAVQGGLGTGGQLQVQGSQPAPSAAPPAPAPAPTPRRK